MGCVLEQFRRRFYLPLSDLGSYSTFLLSAPKPNTSYFAHECMVEWGSSRMRPGVPDWLGIHAIDEQGVLQFSL